MEVNREARSEKWEAGKEVGNGISRKNLTSHLNIQPLTSIFTLLEIKYERI